MLFGWRRDWSDAHDLGRHTRGRVTDEAGMGRSSELARFFFRHDERAPLRHRWSGKNCPLVTVPDT
jgi:hypothetical protein